MLSPFLVSPSITPPIPPPSPCSPTNSLPLPGPGILLHWGIESSQDQGPLLSMMTNKAILCYICSWSHGSLHVYSGWWFSPWEIWGFWLFDIVVLPMGLQTPSAPSVLSLNSSTRVTKLSLMDGCVHLHLYWSSSSRASQETALSDSCQQALLGISNSVWVWFLTRLQEQFSRKHCLDLIKQKLFVKKYP